MRSPRYRAGSRAQGNPEAAAGKAPAYRDSRRPSTSERRHQSAKARLYMDMMLANPVDITSVFGEPLDNSRASFNARMAASAGMRGRSAGPLDPILSYHRYSEDGTRRVTTRQARCLRKAVTRWNLAVQRAGMDGDTVDGKW